MPTITFHHEDPQTEIEYTVTAEVSPVRYNEEYEWTGTACQVDVEIVKVVDGEGYEAPLSGFTIFQIMEMQAGAVDALARMPEQEMVTDETWEEMDEVGYQEHVAERYVNEWNSDAVAA